MSESPYPDDTRDALRKIGGLLLGLGALMILLRKGQGWGDFPIFLVLAVPAAFLYGFGVNTIRDTGGVRPWQAVYAVFGLILATFALRAFVNLIGGTSGADLNVFWTFAVVAGLGIYAGLLGVRFGFLAACIAAIISWTALWDKILGDKGIGGHIGAYRGLLGILAILLLVAGIRVWRGTSDRDEGLRRFSEFFTGAGIAAVLGSALAASQVLATFIAFPFIGSTLIGTSTLWDVLLLIVSLALVGIGSTIGTRGPVYVGAIGLGLFLLIAGLDLNSKPPHPTNLGLWPLLLLAGGAAAIVASLSEGVSLGDRPKEWVRRIGGG